MRERTRVVRWWRLWRTRRPVTFTDKVKYKMLRDHRRLLVTFADKAAVRDHVESLVGPGFLPTVYAVLDSPSDLVDLELPAEFVMKPTHGSGAVVVVSDNAEPDTELPPIDACWSYTHVRPKRADRRHLAAIADFWTRQLYGQGPNREWAYGAVPRRILVEELLTGPHDGIADDYKFFVFHGRCEFVQVDTGRFGGRTQDFYRRPWTHLPLSGGPPHADPPQNTPPKLDTMIEIAETLSRGTDFVRVDLYVVGSRIVVGELTSYPAGGNSPFEPASYDREFGRYWTVPRRYTD
ncbi:MULTISPECIES: ATP-grasp fold amidoligase family protein [Nocardiaceae]|nr:MULTISPECIES: ATP-grasp fold amidoligase family protein [Rhodococcus]